MESDFRSNVAMRQVFRKIFFIFFFISIFSLLFTYIGLSIQSSVRAYVAGEGMWSKSQRDASYYLELYGRTRDPAYLNDFERALRVPRALRKARLALLEKDFNKPVIAAGLLAGGTHTNDISGVIMMFRCCAKFGYFKEAIKNWEIGDQYLVLLEGLKVDLQNEVNAEYPAQAKIDSYLHKIVTVNSDVSHYETAFTNALGNGARFVTRLLLVITVVVIGGLISIGAYLSYRMAKNADASEEQYRLLFNSASDAICIFDRLTRRITQANRKAMELSGCDTASLLGTTYEEFFSTIDGFEIAPSNAHRLLIRQRGGRMIPVEVSGNSTDWYGRPVYLAIIRDISEQLEFERTLRISANAMANMGEAVVITDASGKLISVNRAFTDITGFLAQDVANTTLFQNVLKQDRRLKMRKVVSAIWQEGTWRGEAQGERKNGEIFLIKGSASAVRNAAGRVENIVIAFSDITVGKGHEKQLLQMASHDALTQLPNRTAFHAHFNDVLSENRSQDTIVALLFIDLDGFKLINDTYGHAVGDDVLRGVASCLSSCVRPEDFVARLGGDEFTILLTRAATVSDVTSVASKILDALSNETCQGRSELTVLASIGISLFPQDGENVENLLTRADTAMYEAKHKGRNNFQFYDAGMTVDATSRFQLLGALRHAVSKREFELHYQPCVSLKDGKIVAIEALIRWNHPQLGIISPEKFILLAEETGLIGAISEWVITTACTQVRAWQKQEVPIVMVAVNISPYNFWDGNLPTKLREILLQTGCPPEMLCLEITENAMMNREKSLITLNSLNHLGVKMAIDDFGVGYSSLSYLKDFPVQYLKIDRSFMVSSGEDINNAAIIRTILALAKTLGLKVIAEGVETEEQRTFLLQERCDEAQGFFFGKPMTAEQIERRLGDTDHTCRRTATLT